MKRFSIVLLICSLASAVVIAQVVDFNQVGRATQVMQVPGLFIAHPTLPLNSTMMIENLATGQIIQVTITGRVPAAAARIADLSPAAWTALGLTPATDIRIFSPAPPPLIIAAPPPPPVVITEPLPEPEPVIIAAPPPPPVVITEPLPEPEPVIIAEPPPPPVIVVEPPVIIVEAPPPVIIVEPAPPVIIVEPAPVIIAEPPPPVVIAEPPPPPVVIAEPPPPPEPVIVERILETIVERHYFIYPEILERLLALEAWQIAQGVRELATEPSPVPTFPIDPELLERILRLEIRQDLLEDQRFAPAPEPAPAPPQVVHVVPPPPQPAPTLPPIVFLQPPPVQPAPPPPTVFVPHTPPAPIQWPHVIPGLPNPHSGMVHRLQVGAFSSLESAVTLSNSMANAGFFVIHELHQGMFRVIALGVPASMVYPAIHRLASLGVTQVWIQ